MRILAIPALSNVNAQRLLGAQPSVDIRRIYPPVELRDRLPEAVLLMPVHGDPAVGIRRAFQVMAEIGVQELLFPIQQ